MKHCPNCGEEKSLDEFYKNSGRPDGLSSYCKSCALAKTKESQTRIRALIGEEAWLARQRNATRRHRERNPDKSRRTQKAYSTALSRLRDEYPSRFKELHDEALSELDEEDGTD